MGGNLGFKRESEVVVCVFFLFFFVLCFFVVVFCCCCCCCCFLLFFQSYYIAAMQWFRSYIPSSNITTKCILKHISVDAICEHAEHTFWRQSYAIMVYYIGTNQKRMQRSENNSFSPERKKNIYKAKIARSTRQWMFESYRKLTINDNANVLNLCVAGNDSPKTVTRSDSPQIETKNGESRKTMNM